MDLRIDSMIFENRFNDPRGLEKSILRFLDLPIAIKNERNRFVINRFLIDSIDSWIIESILKDEKGRSSSSFSFSSSSSSSSVFTSFGGSREGASQSARRLLWNHQQWSKKLENYEIRNKNLDFIFHVFRTRKKMEKIEK